MQIAILTFSFLIVLFFYTIIGFFKFLTKKNIKSKYIKKNNPQEKEIKIQIDKLNKNILDMKWDSNSDTSDLEIKLEELKEKLKLITRNNDVLTTEKPEEDTCKKGIAVPFGIPVLAVWLVLSSLATIGDYSNAMYQLTGISGPIVLTQPAKFAVEAGFDISLVPNGFSFENEFTSLYNSIFIKPICLIFTLIIIIAKPKSSSFLLCSNIFLSITIYFLLRFLTIVDSSIFNLTNLRIGFGDIIVALIFIIYISTSKKVKDYFSK